MTQLFGKIRAVLLENVRGRAIFHHYLYGTPRFFIVGRNRLHVSDTPYYIPPSTQPY
jgi:hypothetical protein